MRAKVYYEDMKGALHEARFRASVRDLERFRRIGESPDHVAAEALIALNLSFQNAEESRANSLSDRAHE